MIDFSLVWFLDQQIDNGGNLVALKDGLKDGVGVR